MLGRSRVTSTKEIPPLIESAARLHGHLGPFLVLGVRIGEAAKSNLHVDERSSHRLQAIVRTPLSTPFSCVIDGIQASTTCTVGNQRLKIEKSATEISASFTLQGTNKTTKILVNHDTVESLVKKMSEGASPEQLARKIVNMQVEQLFELTKQNGH
jgi:formylmethanofuran dehydrogenase subunit E